LPVLWCDTGYNTEATYKHAQNLTERFHLNVEIFTPKFTTAYLNASLGIPEIGNPKHQEFAKIVKLEPFARAMAKHQPDVWFTTIRKNQTEYRNTLDILSFTKDGVLRVSPFYHFSDEEIQKYLSDHNLPVAYDYFDPVKAMSHRECGIHLTK
jgi:phosphoadenosine phosphosulfate reductase